MAENIDLMVKIRTIYNQFTKTEKKVADYILSNPRKVLFQSITELADTCGVGETSIFRFCRTVGFSGYQEFKMQFSLGLSNSGDSEASPTGNITREDDLQTVVKKILYKNQQALEETAVLLNCNELGRAVDLLTRANRIIFFGVGASLTAAMKASSKFLRIEPKAICVNDAHMQAMMAATMTAEDVAIVFSHSGSTRDTTAVAALAKENGASVISITRFQKSPLTEYTDIALLCGANEGPLQGGSAGADICQTFLIDLLYTEYYRRNYEHCSINNQKTSRSVLPKLY